MVRMGALLAAGSALGGRDGFATAGTRCADRRARLAPGVVAIIACALLVGGVASAADVDRRFTLAQAAAVIRQVPHYPRVNAPFRPEREQSYAESLHDVARWNGDSAVSVAERQRRLGAAGFVGAGVAFFRGRGASVSAEVVVFADERGARRGFAIIKEQNLEGFFEIKPFAVHGLAGDAIGLHGFNEHGEDFYIQALWRVGNIVLSAEYFPDTAEASLSAACNRSATKGKCPSSMLSIPRLRAYADEINRRAGR
jgi:hypothetical protein